MKFLRGIQSITTIPYYERKMLQRAEKSQISRVLRKNKYGHMGLGSLQLNVVGFIKEVKDSWSNVNKNVIYGENYKQRSNMGQRTNGDDQKTIFSVWGILYTLHSGFLVKQGKIKEEEAVRRMSFFRTKLEESVNSEQLKEDRTRDVEDLVEFYYNGGNGMDSLANSGDDSLAIFSNDSSEFVNEESTSNNSTITLSSPFNDLLNHSLAYLSTTPYTFQDLRCWLQSLSQKSFGPAYIAVCSHSSLPGFVVLDLLYKNVSCANDVMQLFQLYKSNYDAIHKRIKYPVFLHLLQMCQIFNRALIPQLTAFYISHLKTVVYPLAEEIPSSVLYNFNYYDSIPAILPRSDQIHIAHINYILYILSNYQYKTHFEVLDSIRAQNTVISLVKTAEKLGARLENQRFVIQSLPETPSLADSLNLVGNCAILTSLESVGSSTVTSKFQNISDSYVKPLLDLVSGSENSQVLNKLFSANGVSRNSVYTVMTYYFKLRLLLCRSAIELAEQFAQITNFRSQFSDSEYLDFDMSKSSLLWETFVLQMENMGMLTSQRADSLLEKIVQGSVPYNINSRYTGGILLKRASNIDCINKFIHYVVAYKLMNGHMLEIYIQLLYSHAKTQAKTSIKGYTSLLSYVRGLYNSIESPSGSLQGLVLYHECTIQPENAYNLYLDYLTRNKVPDQNCLKGLLVAAQNQDLVWANQYAIQVAIAQFKHWTPQYAGKEGCLVYSKTWKLYIDALILYDYHNQLKQLIVWWQDLRYVPSKSLLSLVLDGLPGPEATRFSEYGRNLLGGDNDSAKRGEKAQEDVYVPIEYEYSVEMWPWQGLGK